MDRACKDCEWWVDTAGIDGTCQRMPKAEKKMWDDWCGEFKINKEALHKLQIKHLRDEQAVDWSHD